jgi:hypothetical protein
MRKLVSSGSPYESKIGMSRFIDPEWLVEFEVDAVIA